MSSLPKLLSPQTSSFIYPDLNLAEHYDGHRRTVLPRFRSTLALLMALLLPGWQLELLAQQQASPLQLGHPGQDYSGQIQSDDAGYAPQQGYPAAQSAYQTQQDLSGQAYPQQENASVVQPLPPKRLQQLVAPIALYPDSLVGLVLAASTYPAQVQDADAWLQSQGSAPPERIAAGANVQNWDP